MPRRPPPRRLVVQRSSDNPKRDLCDPAPSAGALAQLASRVIYAGYGKHKLKPKAFGLEPYRGASEDRTYCDGHADFQPSDMTRARGVLVRGIRAGLVGGQLRDGDPSLLWTVDDGGWIYEARLTTAGQAIYHGYPVLPRDAMARKVIARYLQWVYGFNDPALRASLTDAQERYAQ